MKPITIIGIGILTLLLVGGCLPFRDRTEEACSLIKHGVQNTDYNIYMDSKMCIIEWINYTHVYHARCSSTTTYSTFIIKADAANLSDIETFESMSCELTELSSSE